MHYLYSIRPWHVYQTHDVPNIVRSMPTTHRAGILTISYILSKLADGASPSSHVTIKPDSELCQAIIDRGCGNKLRSGNKL